MKIVVLSSLAKNTGSAVRAKSIADSLKKGGVDTEFVKPFSFNLPFKLDLLLSLPYYFIKVFQSSARIMITVKSYPNTMVPMIIKRILFKTKIIVDTDDLSYAYTQGIPSILSKFGEELFLQLADLHTYHNLRLFEYLKQIGIPQEKTYQLKQGVDLSLFNCQKNKQEQKNNLIFVGHFDSACDLGVILKSMPLVFKRFPDTKLILAGDGLRKKEFQTLADKLRINSNLIWTGLVSQKKTAELINQTGICLLYYKPNKANLFRSSLKLREYLSLGKKVVCNNVGELRDFSQFTYQTKSSQKDFANMITKVLTGFDDKRQQRGKQFVIRHYSWKKISLEFIKKIKELFETKKT